MSTLHSLLTVLVVALVLGAGLPTLFSLGVRLDAAGSAEGQHTKGISHFLAWVIYALCLAVIIAGVLWITNATIAHYTGINIYGTSGGH
ncbi:hypothetical protein I6J22_07600 [Corynebacterium kroppenstedtii]|uniref:Putative secreted protein n=1 Tax=Corynebacterium kroppenstedtii (strain DSM 44385 / JCM 11950 / CIP 105744 / CCUG 35717) TaxID=645127 RepID=C4LLA0_CORK4|nr:MULTISPECIES: hypothetical protein [Corynebacterium]ACR18605.1 putative secreted protein [Corynebacterium kroppenstedtii DSM 44385]MDK7146804.1 hypothetical protein [Corynebacterium pseudokroppenstedtii]MDU6479720.1 hypothetical protein [Corynebacterium kroppenstedtii]MDU7503288.1 hypothetical protein [Corynebacterium kroppenstedtii]QRP10079.1 hypothetical protein I6J22_07600 [Corynebacterium kroppenstedtii]